MTKYVSAVAVALFALAFAAAPARAEQSEEAQLGQQVFDQLKSRGEIVASSPLYRVLNPLSTRITQVVAPKYGAPIKFYIVHESQPNAFAAPGGNVYVTDSLFYFVKNTEELAGTICHETSHLLHHDTMTQLKQEQRIRERAAAATILLGPTLNTILVVSAIGKLDSLHYSRQEEENADLTGSRHMCASRLQPMGPRVALQGLLGGQHAESAGDSLQSSRLREPDRRTRTTLCARSGPLRAFRQRPEKRPTYHAPG
jgi:predicted Zn-dependent protease